MRLIKEKANMTSYNKKAQREGILLSQSNASVFWEAVDWEDDEIRTMSGCDRREEETIHEEFLLFISNASKEFSSVYEAWASFDKIQKLSQNVR